jgi:hypothetical protein
MSTANDEFERWSAQIEADGLLADADGRVRFTAARREDLRLLFALAGIDIRTIRTMDAYLRAREASRPYFGQWLSTIARRGPRTAERQLLIAIVEGDVADAAERARLA